MKIELEKSDFTQDILVNLFSTAFYGSTLFRPNYNREKYARLFSEDDCFEDRLAKIILNGGKFWVVDLESEDGEPYNVEQTKVESCPLGGQNLCAYFVTLDTIMAGFKNAIEHTTLGENEDWMGDLALIILRDGDYDSTDAQNMLQIILFNELIYG